MVIEIYKLQQVAEQKVPMEMESGSPNKKPKLTSGWRRGACVQKSNIVHSIYEVLDIQSPSTPTAVNSGMAKTREPAILWRSQKAVSRYHLPLLDGGRSREQWKKMLLGSQIIWRKEMPLSIGKKCRAARLFRERRCWKRRCSWRKNVMLSTKKMISN